jgi:hypothetical protein
VLGLHEEFSLPLRGNRVLWNLWLRGNPAGRRIRFLYAQGEQMTLSDHPAFREVQWIRRVWWVMLLIGGIACLTWYSFWQQILLGRPVGTNPGPDWAIAATWLLCGIGLPVLLLTMRLIVEVFPDHVSIRYVPLLRRRIMTAEIAHFRARSYRPIIEYGGWGIKGWSMRRIAYSVGGNQGVELELRDGRRVMIGSQRSDELEAALGAVLPPEPEQALS